MLQLLQSRSSMYQPPCGYCIQTACHCCFFNRADADVMTNVWEFALFLSTVGAKYSVDRLSSSRVCV